MNILLLSSGGGGGNILRSLKMLFARDVAVAQKSDAKYAERLRRAVTTRFLDTNEFSLADVPKEERLLIGPATTQRLGSGHCPEVARAALEESSDEVERLLARYSVVVILATGGKGTGAGTMFPLTQMARRQKKLVIPVFVRPSFERHEVDKRRYDHAVRVTEQFDAARIRLIEILNDRAYREGDPQPQSVVWERMNVPIARGLRGLLYVLWDLSQVDPSDLSMLLAGEGRLRIGFSEIDPAAGREPSDSEIDEAVRRCWHNPYCAFSRAVGTSLVCIHGDWSNLVDARIKGQLAALALGGATDHPYNPLYARAIRTPKPWGVTALFAEHTGRHEALEIDWTGGKKITTATSTRLHLSVSDLAAVPPGVAPGTGADDPLAPVSNHAEDAQKGAAQPTFATFWEFARALNRSDPAAVALAAGEGEPETIVDPLELKKVLGTFWFRSVFPRFSGAWRERLLDVLVASVEIPNHVVRMGRHAVHLKGLSYMQLQEVFAKTLVRGTAGADLQLLLAIGGLWGEEALTRLRFTEVDEHRESSRFATLLQGLRS